MTTPAEYQYAQTVIARFSRGDHIQWQNVAAVLGRCVEDVKREFDLTIPPPPAEEELPEGFILTRPPSPYPSFRLKVLAYLVKGPSNRNFIAAATGMTLAAAGARLAELHADNLASHDGVWGKAAARTWTITAEGKSFADQHALRRTPSKEEQAA